MVNYNHIEVISLKDKNKKVSIKLERHRWPDEIAKDQQKRRKAFKIVIAIIVAFLLGTQFNKISNLAAGPTDAHAGVERFERVYRDLLASWYFKTEMEQPESEMIDNAIKGMLEKNGDQHTSYMTQEEMNNLNESINMNFDGIGVQYYAGNGANIITRVFKGSPAEGAGLLAGDVLSKVDGVEIKTVDREKIQELIMGKEGTPVKVEVLRDQKPIEFDIKRGKINALVWGEVRDGVGYIEISSFGKNLADATKLYLDEFLEHGVDKLVIDLRDNGGGYLQAIEDIARIFFDNDEVVYKEDFMNNSEKVYKVSDSEKAQYPFKDIAVLINEKSASASEVLTLALQENRGVKVVGVNSYGKGTVQTQHEYSDKSALKVTIAKWNSPKGNNIHGTGIKPDVEVKLPAIFYTNFVVLDDSKEIHVDTVHEAVVYTQNALKFLGYHNGRTDGYYDTKTSEALMKYKAELSLEVNDTIDHSIQEQLYSSVVSEWSSNRNARDVQLQKAIEVVKNGK